MQLLINPIAFSIGGIHVHWYGIILGTAALVGLLMCIQEGKRFHIPPEFFMDLLLIGVPSAIIGARIYYVVFKWQDYSSNLMEIFKIWHGGIAIYGALIGAIIGAVIYVRRKGYNFWRIADIAAPGLIIGQAIGRWGNFMNQEAYGGPTTEAFLRNTLHLPDFIVNQMLIDGIYRHPTFLYESIWNLLGLAVLLILRRSHFLRAGEMFLSYFIIYSVGRFFVEGLRTDSLVFQGPALLSSLMETLWAPMQWFGFTLGTMSTNGNIRISQLLAVLIIIGAIVLMYVRRKKGYANELYTDPIVSSRMGAIGPSREDGSVESAAAHADAPDEVASKASGLDKETSGVSGEHQEITETSGEREGISETSSKKENRER